MKYLTLMTMAAMTAAPALAQPENSMMLLRDSDGLVISILYPVDYYGMPDSAGGGVVYTMGGHEVQFSPSQNGTSTVTEASVNGTAYEVEVVGQNLWLTDPVTGKRNMAQQQPLAPDAMGFKVNPTGFEID